MTLQFEDIPVSKIHAHPNNVRTELGDLTELIESVKAKGILQALTVTPHPTVKDAYLLIAGHRRLAAGRLAKLRTAPCIINSDLNTETEQLEAMLVENLQRVDISPMEEARAYQHLLDLDGYDIKRLAKSTGRSQRLVKERVKLGQLPEEQAASLHEGTLTIERALVMVDFADDPKAVKVLEAIPARDQSTWEVQVKRLQKERDWAAGLPQLRKDLAAAGVELVDAPEGPTYTWTEFFAGYTSYETVEEWLAAGYNCAIVDTKTTHPFLGNTTSTIWVKRKAAQQEYVAPTPTPEQVATLKRREDITAALAIAAEVREAHVLERIRKTSHAAARAALEDVVRDGVHPRRIAWALGMHWTEELDEQEVFDALPKLTLEQLAVLTHFNHFEAEASLLQLHGWDRRSYWHGERTGPWLTALKDVYGYDLSDPEKEALAYWPVPAAEEAEDADAA